MTRKSLLRVRERIMEALRGSVGTSHGVNALLDELDKIDGIIRMESDRDASFAAMFAADSRAALEKACDEARAAIHGGGLPTAETPKFRSRFFLDEE